MSASDQHACRKEPACFTGGRRNRDRLPGSNQVMAIIPLPSPDLTVGEQPNPSTIVLGGGCFWCVEAVYLPVDGVLKVRSGYAGDSEGTANYQAVCSGT